MIEKYSFSSHTVLLYSPTTYSTRTTCISVNNINISTPVATRKTERHTLNTHIFIDKQLLQFRLDSRPLFLVLCWISPVKPLLLGAWPNHLSSSIQTCTKNEFAGHKGILLSMLLLSSSTYYLPT